MAAHKRDGKCVVEKAFVTVNLKAKVKKTRIQSRTFLLPLSKGVDVTMWSGTTNKKTARQGALDAIDRSQQAKKTKFYYKEDW